MKRYGLICVMAALFACADDSSGSSDLDGGAPIDAGATQDGSVVSASGDGGVTTEAARVCTTLPGQQARVACAANAVLATLTAEQRGGVNLPLTDYVSRSKWSNFPVQMKPRGGVQLGSLGASSQAAVLDLMNIALSSNGQATLTGILRADDYLADMTGGYGSELYAIAIYGTPSASSDFEVMFGGHHMAYNLNFVGGSFYPVPQHLGCEPKGAFAVDGVTYEPMKAKGDAVFAIYDALDASQRTAAYLAGQTFSDVLVNPDLDYGKGQSRTSNTAYPTGSNRRGVLVSSMNIAQQAMVTSALEQWVRQYPPELVDSLMSAYTGAYVDTYFAWAGASSGPGKDVSGSYLRIDGPRAWLELAVQGGIVIRGQTHFHTIYHDKTFDYGGQF